MIEITTKQLNTKEYWDKVYITERGSGKERIDGQRLYFVKTCIERFGKPYGTFLDVGCGNGEFMKKMWEELPDIDYSGCDIANGTIANAMADYPNFHFRVCDAQFLSQENTTFDMVWCGETIEHLKAPQQCISELFRVTKTGGLVFISTPLRGNNPSDEHLWMFDLMDFVNIKDGVLLDIDVVCNGLSMIACWRKK